MGEYCYTIEIYSENFEKYFDIEGDLARGFIKGEYLRIIELCNLDMRVVLYFPIFGETITDSKYGWNSYEVASEDPYKIEIDVFSENKKDIAKFKLMV